MRGGKREGAGRPAGSLDKGNKQLREMILEALEAQEGGGVNYLTGLAKTDAKAFVSLLGRVLPTQVTGDGGGPIEHEHSGTVGLSPSEAYLKLIHG